MKRPLRILALLLATTIGAAAAQATTDDKARQYKLEAAFIYNFFNYITWPGYSAPDELASATVCVTAGDPIEPYLSYVQQKMSDQRQLVVRHLNADNAAEGCQLVFLRRGTAQSRTTTPILTVTTDTGAASGSMIAMHEVEGRMALTINNTELAEQGFQASSRLLSLAQEVK